MHRKSGILIFCLFITLTANCQIIFSGKIVDLRSAPIANATVQFLNTNLAAISDTNGNFSVRLFPGKYEIKVTSVSHSTLVQAIVIPQSSNTPIVFSMSDEALQLDGIVVSAQKKEELLQKVPLSISALSAKQVAEYRLWNSQELTAIVPNMYSANSGDERNVTSIRGIATTSYDPAVATYIDGVNQFSLDTYIASLSDIERIEVLRGPQGTLYGRNAMGGVVNIITKQPSNKLSGFAELNAGNYRQQRYNMGIKAPLLKNKLFLGISALYNSRDGFYENEFNKASFDKQHVLMGNYYLRFLAGTKWAIVLNAKHRQNRNKGAFPLVNGVDESLQNPFVLNQDAVAKMIDNSFNSSLSVNHSGRNFNFSSHTAFQSNYRYYDKPLDGDFSPIDGITIINDYGKNWNRVKVLTQELKFSSPAATMSRLKWTLGSYLFHQNNPVKQAVHFGNDAMLVGAPDINFSIISTTKARTTGVALFGQGTYSISKKIRFIGGLRYDYERKKYNILGQYQKDPDPIPLFDTRPDTSASADFTALSPKVGVSVNLNSHSDAFVTYSRGYRTGGLTALGSDPSQPPLYPYNPEFSNNIEIGLKNNLFSNRLQLNIYAFLTHVTDAQVPTLLLPDAVTVTQNTGKLTSKGIELEVAATPVKGLQVNYNFGYTDARYRDGKLSQNGTLINLDGKRQIFTPDVTSMLALQYSYSVRGKQHLKLIARTEWTYLGNRYFDLVNSIKQNDRSLLNIRFGIASKYLSLMFWARNVTGENYIAYAYDFGAIHLGDPKTFGITLAAGF